MAENYLPPIEFLRECFLHHPELGIVWWRKRPDNHFESPERANNWNSQNAFMEAGSSGGRNHTIHVKYNGRGHRLLRHRLVFALETGRTDFGELDHIDCDPQNDAFHNLREASRNENMANNAGWAKTGLPKGVVCVGTRFRAQATAGGKTRNLGTYDTHAEAHAAYCAFAKQIHGEFFNPGPERPSVFD